MTTPLLLIAAPDGPTETRGQVILVAVQSSTGALGFSINRAAHGESFTETLEAVGIDPRGIQNGCGHSEATNLPSARAKSNARRPRAQADAYHDGLVLVGGRTQQQNVWLLFDGAEDLPEDSAVLAPALHITACVDAAAQILRQRNGFAGAALVRGHHSWEPGSLKAEIEEGRWLVAPLNTRHIFETPIAARWREALCEAMGAQGPWWREAPLACA